MEMIKTQDLAFTYPGTEDQVNTRALRGVDVTIERGSFVVILGHNGSGKSTLAKTFNAVLLPSGLNFKGAGRRFEVYGECNGALVVDDYAHHPTELRATLTTAKEMGYKRLIAVHQPFTYSRTKMLFNDFVDVLKIPDITVLTPIMGSREPNDPSITSAKLAAQIPGSVLVNSLEEAADWVKQNAREGDLVITLGCGDIYKASKMMVAEQP